MQKLISFGLVTTILSLGSCARPGVHYILEGNVFNGVTAEALTDYTITLNYADVKVSGKVTGGKYKIDYLPSYVDFTITIEAAGYRPFTSTNNQMGDNGGPTSVATFLLRDATLYPTDLQAPAQTINVVLGDSQSGAMAGTVRFRPQADGAIFGQVAGSAGSWHNSLNIEAPTVIKTIANGQVSLAAGELVFGVTYEILVFGVNNYAIDGQAGITAGDAANLTVTLRPITAPSAPVGSPRITSTNVDNDPVIANGELRLYFNGPVRLANSTQTVADLRKSLAQRITVSAKNLCGAGGGGNNGGGCGGGPVDSNNCTISQATRDGFTFTVTGNEAVFATNWNGNASLSCAPNGNPGGSPVVYRVCYPMDGFELGRTDMSPFVPLAPASMIVEPLGQALGTPKCVQVLGTN